MPVRFWLFWLPYLLGSGVLAFAVLLGQVPGEDRTFDLVMFSVAAALLTLCLWLGFFHSRAPYLGAIPGTTKSALQVLTGTQIVFAIYGAIAALTYRGL